MFACKSINMRAFLIKNIVHSVKKMFHATFLQRNERKITIFQSSIFNFPHLSWHHTKLVFEAFGEV